MKIDKYIWSNFRKGSRSSFEDLYDMYFDTLYLYAYHLKPDSEIIEDIIHDVFLELWDRREKLPDVMNIKAYLMKIIRRKMFSRIKRYLAQLESDVILKAEYDFPEQTENDETEIKKLKLRCCLKNLSSRQREVIHLKYYENLSTSEIRNVTGLSQQRIYNIVSESLSRLKSLMVQSSILFILFISLSILLIF